VVDLETGYAAAGADRGHLGAGLTVDEATNRPGDDFEDAPEDRVPAELVLDLDGFEGPIDVLLSLAREQKVDLTRISILQLADQYLDYVRRARRQRLELAADYLVMAAWLAYLKSRLLLPDEGAEGEPSGEELAEALAYQLRLLEAMREAARRLMARDLLGRDVFARGAPDGIEVVAKPIYAITLNDLLAAYAEQRGRREVPSALHIGPNRLMTLDAAVRRLSRMLGMAVEWTMLARFLPADVSDPLLARSALASTFAATLELCREGRLRLRQAAPFAPIFVRSTDRDAER
jgi:segregation and condensation protein A